jgi:hypothetical protein
MLQVLFSYKKTNVLSGFGLTEFLWSRCPVSEASFAFFLPLCKHVKPCRRKLSTIGTMPLSCRSHLPLHHISLDWGGAVIGVLYVCISRRRRHLRRWIGLDRITRRRWLVRLHHPRSVECFRYAISSRVWSSHLSLLLIISPRLDLGFLVRIRRIFLIYYVAKPFYGIRARSMRRYVSWVERNMLVALQVSFCVLLDAAA